MCLYIPVHAHFPLHYLYDTFHHIHSRSKLNTEISAWGTFGYEYEYRTYACTYTWHAMEEWYERLKLNRGLWSTAEGGQRCRRSLLPLFLVWFWKQSCRGILATVGVTVMELRLMEQSQKQLQHTVMNDRLWAVNCDVIRWPPKVLIGFDVNLTWSWRLDTIFQAATIRTVCNTAPQ